MAAKRSKRSGDARPDAKPKALTARQQRFVEEYLIDLNATAAYKRAGYKCKSAEAAKAAASRMLTFVNVQAAIQEGMARLAEKAQLSAEKVLAGLQAVGFSDIGQILDFSGGQVKLRPASEIPEQARHALASMKVKRYFEGHGDAAREVEVTEFRLWDKLDALVKLGQHLGLFVERREHDTGKGGTLIELIEITGVEVVPVEPSPPSEAPAA